MVRRSHAGTVLTKENFNVHSDRIQVFETGSKTVPVAGAPARHIVGAGARSDVRSSGGALSEGDDVICGNDGDDTLMGGDDRHRAWMLGLIGAGLVRPPTYCPLRHIS